MSLANALSTAIHSDGKPNLVSVADLDLNPQPYGGLFDLVEVSAGELKRLGLTLPKAGYYVRAEFEDGTDRYLSFDAKRLRETDERDGSPVEYYDLYNLHLDGKPGTVADVDGLFEGGFERLQEWLLEQEVRE
jgi:hypothetical protein